MTASFESEQREFIRLPLTLTVGYRFISELVSSEELNALYEGSTQNLGTGGLLLNARLPDPQWLPNLLTRSMFVGVNFRLPLADKPIKALCRAVWTSALEDGNAIVLGLAFHEIAQEDRDLITRYIIRTRMPE
ncbi:MAG: PilZ domain-containing protein [Planctomycetota bacterium]|jgi:hypothetical protein